MVLHDIFQWSWFISIVTHLHKLNTNMAHPIGSICSHRPTSSGTTLGYISWNYKVYNISIPVVQRISPTSFLDQNLWTYLVQAAMASWCHFPIGGVAAMELLSPAVPWSRLLLLCQFDIVQAWGCSQDQLGAVTMWQDHQAMVNRLLQNGYVINCF